MDAFEEIVGVLLENDKYWIRHSVKINLTKKEKAQIGKPWTPRPEIDIVAFDAMQNLIILIEVKSFLDSKGVIFEKVVENNEHPTGRYKLLTSKKYQDIIAKRLKSEWIDAGFINKKTKVSFGLIAGKISKMREVELNNYFSGKNWFFWGPTNLKEKLTALSKKGYENCTITIVTKLMQRKPAHNSRSKRIKTTL